MRDRLEAAVFYLETLAALLLVLLAAAALAGVVAALIEGFGTWDAFGDPHHVIDVVDAILVFFIVIELFRIALAYMCKRGVVTTVLEAALVAVARELVVFIEVKENVLETAGALAVLLLGVGVTWFLLSRAGVEDEHV
jgi:uncharacterized membrane protein (DUF373 family)